MARERAAVHVPFEVFSNDLNGFFERVIRDHETIVVEKEAREGIVDGVVMKPVRLVAGRKGGRRKRTAADYEAFLSAFGGWSDVDVDDFLKRIYESRNMPSRPPVDL